MIKKKTEENRVEKIIGISFLVIGILLVAGSFLATYLSIQHKATSQKVMGVVVGTYNGTEVEYTFREKEYEVTLSESSSNIHVGDEIALYVNPTNPKNVRTAELLFLQSFILSIVGLPFLIIGIVFLIIVRRRSKTKKLLIQTGRKIYAKVTGGEMVYNYMVNNRHPFKLECTYTDFGTGAVYLFSSRNMWLDPNFYIGQQIEVYVNPDNYKKYYVNVDSLQKAVEVYDFR